MNIGNLRWLTMRGATSRQRNETVAFPDSGCGGDGGGGSGGSGGGGSDGGGGGALFHYGSDVERA